MSDIPADLRYARSHEWARVEGDTVTVGITDHAQHELTDVVFVELPPVGRTLRAGEACAVIESVKTAGDIYAPVAGTVTAVNPEAIASPGLLNTDPYGAGWLFQLKVPPDSGLAALLDAAAYRAHLGAAA
jgi:glycine cleavage system H protein